MRLFQEVVGAIRDNGCSNRGVQVKGLHVLGLSNGVYWEVGQKGGMRRVGNCLRVGFTRGTSSSELREIFFFGKEVGGGAGGRWGLPGDLTMVCSIHRVPHLKSD
jgi:hypothetical protein